MCCHRSRGGGVRLAVPVNHFVTYSGLLEGCPRLDPTKPGVTPHRWGYRGVMEGRIWPGAYGSCIKGWQPHEHCRAICDLVNQEL